MIEETNKIIEKLDKTEDIVRMKELKDKLNSNKEYLNLMSEFEKNKKLYIENNTLDDEIMALRKKLFNIDELKEANVDGYAVVSAILKANDIKLECEKWTRKIEELKN